MIKFHCLRSNADVHDIRQYAENSKALLAGGLAYVLTSAFAFCLNLGNQVISFFFNFRNDFFNLVSNNQSSSDGFFASGFQKFAAAVGSKKQERSKRPGAPDCVSNIHAISPYVNLISSKRLRSRS
jgi:hypothetical protein